MSTIKSLEIFNNPKMTTKHQYTPSMLLFLQSSFFMLLIVTYMFDPAVKTEQDRSVELPAVQSQRQCSGYRS